MKDKYTNITICIECGNITERRCCNKDLILYESKHTNFVDSIIPLYKEMNHVQTVQRLCRAMYINSNKCINVDRYNIFNQIYNIMVTWIIFFIVMGAMAAFIKWGLTE